MLSHNYVVHNLVD